MGDGIPYDPDFLLLGWARWLPPTALFAYMAALFLEANGVPGDLGEQPGGGTFSRIVASVGGLDGPAWDEEAGAEGERRRDRVARLAAGAGMAAVETNRDVFELMRRLGLLERTGEAGGVRWRTVSPLPLPEERVEMSGKERQAEDLLRWQELHATGARRLLRLFEGRGARTMTTTLDRVALLIGSDADGAREALLSLKADGCARTSVDVERAAPGDAFELTVEPERFDESRLIGRLVRPDEPSG